MKRSSVLVRNGAVCIAELSRESIGCQYDKAYGDDTLGFTVLSGAEWLKLEDEFGADIVCYYFVPIDLESNMFNLSMSEVSALLGLRENKR